MRDDNAAEFLRLAEAGAGLTRQDYADPDRLKPKLTTLLDGMGLFAVHYLVSLSGALGMVRRNSDSLRVYEAYLDIEPKDYAKPDALLGKISAHTTDLPDEFKLMLVFALIGNLSILGRESQGLALLRADLDLGPASPGLAPAAVVDQVRTHLARRLTGLAPDAVVTYLTALVPYLDGLGVGSDGYGVVEASLGLVPDDYTASTRLGARLDPMLRSLTSPEARVMLLMTLATLLDQAGQYDRALALLEWYVGTGPNAYEDVAELQRRWRAFCDRNHADVGPTVWRMWSQVLVHAARRHGMMALLEADSGVSLADLSGSDRFGPKLERRLRRAQIDTAAAYIFSVSSDLAEIGYAEQAGRVVEWYLRGYEHLWQVQETGDPAVTHVIALVSMWFELASASQPDFAWQLSGQAVAYLRHSLLVKDLNLADRREFIGYVESLREHIKQVGYSWTAEGALSAADQARLVQAQLWDAELGQRALFEEFLLTSDEHVDEGNDPEDRWPYKGSEPIDEGPPDFLTLSEEEVNELLTREDPVQRPAIAAPADGDEPTEVDWAREQWLLDAERIVRRGVTEELIGETLGPDALLVRAGFRPDDGAIVWSALRVGDDGRLLVAKTGVGAQGGQLRARWASLRHDLGLQMATGRRTEPGASGESEGDRLTAVLAETLDRITDVLNEVKASGWGNGDWIDSVFEQLAVLNTERSSLACSGSIGSRIAELLPLPLLEASLEGGELDAAAHQIWLRFAETELSLLRETVRRHAHQVTGRLDVAEIDEVTAAYLAEISDIWRLGPLRSCLDERTDVVFQLEDALQQIPLAHYPFDGGVPLYALVRSTRVSLSVLVTIMQANIEQQFTSSARRILALSYFADDDNAGVPARWLHYGQRWLAQHATSEVICLNAADEPPGSISGLSSALRSGPGFQTVIVCGHGFEAEKTAGSSLRESARSGIKLSDGLWRGAGCDLRSVNFLLLPSCSVGRLRQVGDDDVAGMCALLALNRARSVLACRWPVLSNQAMAFAHEVVANYLKLSEQPDGRARGSLRARAVNAARRHFLDKTETGAQDATRGVDMLLNTVAAFELFGLG